MIEFYSLRDIAWRCLSGEKLRTVTDDEAQNFCDRLNRGTETMADDKPICAALDPDAACTGDGSHHSDGEPCRMASARIA